MWTRLPVPRAGLPLSWDAWSSRPLSPPSPGPASVAIVSQATGGRRQGVPVPRGLMTALSPSGSSPGCPCPKGVGIWD